MLFRSRWVRASSVSRAGECRFCFERSDDRPIVLAFEGERNEERERALRYTQHWLHGRMPSEVERERERPGDDTLLARWLTARRSTPYNRTAASTIPPDEVAPRGGAGIRTGNGHRGRNGDVYNRTPTEALRPTTTMHAGGTSLSAKGEDRS